MSEVESVGLAVGHVRLAHDDDVVTETERAWVVGDGAEVDVRVVAGSLVCRGTVEVPFWEVVKALHLLGEGLATVESAKYVIWASKTTILRKSSAESEQSRTSASAAAALMSRRAARLAVGFC